jgi:hypothetical protein
LAHALLLFIERSLKGEVEKPAKTAAFLKGAQKAPGMGERFDLNTI